MPGKAMHVECWNFITISFSKCPIFAIYYKN